MNIKEDFNNEIRRCEFMIENVSGLNIDVTDFRNRLKEIEKTVDSIVSKGGFLVLERLDYKKSLKSVLELESELLKYQTSYNIRNSVLYLNAYLNEDITKDKIDKSVLEIIKSIQIYKSVNSDDIRDMLFKCVYNIIKLEFIYNDKSKVLDYILSDKEYITIINRLIIDEVNTIFDSINKLFGIDKLQMAFYRNKELDTSYVNEDIFRILVMCTNTNEVRNNVLFSLNAILDKIQDNNNLVRKKYNFISNSDLAGIKNLKKRLIALVLSATIGGGFSCYLFKEISKDVALRNYNTQIHTVTEMFGMVENPSEYMERLEKEHQVILEISNVLKDNGKIYSETYDVTGYVDEDMLSTICPKFDVLEYGLEPISSKKIGSLSKSNINENDYQPKYKYNIYDQDLSDYVYPNDSNQMWGYFVFMEICTLAAVYLFNKCYDNDKLPKELFLYIKRFKEIKNNKNSLNECLDFLDQNEELKSLFIKIYKEKKDLLDDFPEVKNLFDKLVSDSEDLKLKLNKSNFAVNDYEI